MSSPFTPFLAKMILNKSRRTCSFHASRLSTYIFFAFLRYRHGGLRSSRLEDIWRYIKYTDPRFSVGLIGHLSFIFPIICRFKSKWLTFFFPFFSSESNLLHITGTFRSSVEFMQNLDDRVIREFRIRNTCFVLQFWACGAAGTFRDAHFSWNTWTQSSYEASSSDRDPVSFCGAIINFMTWELDKLRSKNS